MSSALSDLWWIWNKDWENIRDTVQRKGSFNWWLFNYFKSYYVLYHTWRISVDEIINELYTIIVHCMPSFRVRLLCHCPVNIITLKKLSWHLYRLCRECSNGIDCEPGPRVAGRGWESRQTEARAVREGGKAVQKEKKEKERRESHQYPATSQPASLTLQGTADRNHYSVTLSIRFLQCSHLVICTRYCDSILLQIIHIHYEPTCFVVSLSRGLGLIDDLS